MSKVDPSKKKILKGLNMKNLKELLKIDLKANMFQGDQLFVIVTSS